MKKFLSFVLCGILITSIFVFCGFSKKIEPKLNENINFYYQNKVFTYNLSKNIKTSDQFDLHYEINKYERFSTKQNRINLLQSMKNLGFDQKIAIEYIFPNIIKTINKIEKTINVSPKVASLTINTKSNDVFKINPEIQGIMVDKQDLYNQIETLYTSNMPLEVQIKTKKIIPSTTKDQLSKFTNLRSDFSTNIASSSTDRKHNVKNALNALNLIEIAPNEVFSFNKTVGKRTPENGYRQAKIIVNNEFVEGMGGGVCQVSTTLYNAALLAGCEIIEANKHSRQVGYVKYGFDAMVNFGSSDLKFRNTTNQKLTIVTNYSPSTARIRIYGEELNSTEYKLKNEIVSTTQAEYEIEHDINCQYSENITYEDECFILKPAINGMVVKSYREKYLNGKLVEKSLLRQDTFKAQNGIKVFGTKKREELFILSR